MPACIVVGDVRAMFDHNFLPMNLATARSDYRFDGGLWNEVIEAIALVGDHQKICSSRP
jgi:hypothetical protein